CFAYTIRECNGACVGNETPEQYNSRVNEFVNNISFHKKSILIIDKGTTIHNKSVVYIENGIPVGMAIFELNHQINHPDILKSLLTPISNNRDAQHIIQNAVRQNKFLKIKELSQILL